MTYLSSSPTVISPHAYAIGNPLIEFVRSFSPNQSQDNTQQPLSPAVTKALEAEKLRQQTSFFPNPRSLLAGALGSYVISRITGNNTPMLMYASNQSVNGISYSVQKVADFFLPRTSSIKKQVAGLLIAAPIVWITADYLGYPLGKAFYIGIAFICIEIFAQGFTTQTRS